MAVKGETATANLIGEILEALNDGKWHTRRELQRKTRLNQDQFSKVIAFLLEYSLITKEDESEKIRVEEDFQKLLADDPV